MTKNKANELNVRSCHEVHNVINVFFKGKKIYSNKICTAELNDVLFTQKDNPLIYEHYSSPVGWTQYYVLNFKSRKILITKKIDEGILESVEKLNSESYLVNQKLLESKSDLLRRE